MKFAIVLICLLPLVQNSDLGPENKDVEEANAAGILTELAEARNEKCRFKRNEKCVKTCDCCGPWDICDCTAEFFLGKNFCKCVKGELLNCNLKKKHCPVGKRPQTCPRQVD